MILLADSGSTKTEWRLISKKSDNEGTCITSGINPFYQNTEDILNNLKNQYCINKDIEEIFFYGAGCTNNEKNNIVKTALKIFFNTSNINISNDLMGAARSLCSHNPGIACILGTGSNSCLYNGKDIISNTPPLGFIIGDEGSGAALGKKLVSDLLKNQLPKNIVELFFNEYNTSQSEILDNIYKKPFPNRYLAQFSHFLSRHIEMKEIELIVSMCFSEFIERNLLQYENIEKMDIHFTGSIAYYFKDQLHKALENQDLKPGKIFKTPINGIVKFHSLLK